nr:hypothetical protein [Pseudomonadota bacterium]
AFMRAIASPGFALGEQEQPWRNAEDFLIRSGRGEPSTFTGQLIPFSPEEVRGFLQKAMDLAARKHTPAEVRQMIRDAIPAACIYFPGIAGPLNSPAIQDHPACR